MSIYKVDAYTTHIQYDTEEECEDNFLLTYRSIIQFRCDPYTAEVCTEICADTI